MSVLIEENEIQKDFGEKRKEELEQISKALFGMIKNLEKSKD